MYNLKPKKCAVCKEAYQPHQTLQRVCSPKCGLAFAVERREKKEKKQTREMKRVLRETDRSYWIKKAQISFNAWIRERDAGLPCISCGTPDGKGKRNAGHYRPAGLHTALRFDPLNVHGQCERCNTSLSGNLIEYRKGLVVKIGADAVEKLETNYEKKRWTIEELKNICQQYKSKP